MLPRGTPVVLGPTPPSDSVTASSGPAPTLRLHLCLRCHLLPQTPPLPQNLPQTPPLPQKLPLPSDPISPSEPASSLRPHLQTPLLPQNLPQTPPSPSDSTSSLRPCPTFRLHILPTRKAKAAPGGMPSPFSCGPEHRLRSQGASLLPTWSRPMATRQYLLPCPTSASSSGMVIPEMEAPARSAPVLPSRCPNLGAPTRSLSSQTKAVTSAGCAHSTLTQVGTHHPHKASRALLGTSRCWDTMATSALSTHATTKPGPSACLREAGGPRLGV